MVSMTTKVSDLELDEEGTRISLTIVDTPGFGDQVDNEARCGCSTIVHYTMVLMMPVSPRL